MHREILLPMPSSLRCVSKVQNRNTHATTFHHPPHPIPDLRPVPLDMSLRLTENRSKHTHRTTFTPPPLPLWKTVSPGTSLRQIWEQEQAYRISQHTEMSAQPTTHRNSTQKSQHNTQHTEISARHTTHRNLSTAHNTQKSQDGTQHKNLSTAHNIQKSQDSTRHTEISAWHRTHRNLSTAHTTHRNLSTAHNSQNSQKILRMAHNSPHTEISAQHNTEISVQHTTHKNLSTAHDTQKSQYSTQHKEISAQQTQLFGGTTKRADKISWLAKQQHESERNRMR